MKSEFDRTPAGDGPAAEPLIGAHAWPSAVSEYGIGGGAPAPTLAVSVSTQPGPGLPGPADAPAPAARRAAEQAARYGLICSQLDDPRVTVSLLSTLHPGQVLPVADGARSLRRFARAAELFTVTAAMATAPALTGISTLGELLDRYGLPVERLAAANADQPLNRLVDTGQPLAMRTGQIEPDTVPTDSSTLAQVAARLRVSPERLLEDNRGLRLAAGAAWVLPGTVTLPANARTPYLTQAGDTLTALARRFGTTAQDVVAGNAEVAGVLPAGVPIEVTCEASDEDTSDEDNGEDTGEDIGKAVTARTETVAGDSFQAVRARLAEQHASVTLDAVAGELARLGTLLEPGVVLSCPLAVLGSAGDGDAAPLTAAEIEAEYGCPPDAFAAANAAVLGVLQPGVQLSSGTRTVTTAEHDTLNAVLGRLAPDGNTPAIAQVLSDNAAVPLFRPGAQALLPPLPVTVTACPDPAPEPAEPAIPLVVTLRLERASTGENKPSERADTAAAPPRDRDALVEPCLAALPDVRLAADAQDRIWAVWFGSGGISSVRVEHSAGGVLGPRAYALRPPYQRPVDLSAWIRPVTEQGGLGAPALQHFQGVDIEPWARLFLTDLDRHLGEPLSDRLPDSAREQLRAFRLRLATAIAEGLTPLLDEPGSAPAELLSARAALAATARSGLMPAYATVIAQYRAVVLSPYGRDGLPGAWLVGAVAAPGRSDISLSASRTGLNQSGAWCVFALTAADPSGTTSVAFQPRQVYDALELDSPGGNGSGEPVLLRFVRPLAGDHRPATIAAELPPAELPVPLREQPHPVTLQAMTAEATFTGPGRPTLAEATRWTASLTYTHQHAAQDVVRLSMAQPAELPAAAASSLALAEALAGFATAAPELALLLGSDAADPDDTRPEADPSRANAAATLVELATAVTTAWSGHWAGHPPAAPPAGAGPAGAPLIDSYRLRAVRSTEGDQGLPDRLVVSRDGADGDWPAITLVSGDEQAMLTPGPEIDGAREYVAAGPPAAPGPLTVRLAWPGLRGAPRPDARITVTAERNGALRAGTPTLPALVLAARPAQVAIVPPCVRWPEELPLTGNSLAHALQNAFDTFAEQSGEQPGGVRLSVEAGYAEPVGELRTVLPVLLIPELVIGPDSARPVADALQAWQRAYRPATAGAQWQLRVTVLPAREGEPPLLVFDQLVFPVSAG